MSALTAVSTTTTIPTDDQDQDTQPQGVDFKLAQAIIDAANNASDAGAWATQTDAKVVDYYTEQENDVMEINNAALDSQIGKVEGAKDSNDAEKQETIYNNMNQKAQSTMQASNSAISQENTELSNLQSFTSALFSSFGTIINGLNSVTGLINHLL